MARKDIDFLVLGSGIAGLTFALKATLFGTVAIVTKKSDIESNTNYAQGSVVSVFGEDDSFDLHIKDTLSTEAGISNREAVKIMVHEGPDRIQELVNFGAQFTLEEDGQYFDLGIEDGHSRKRIVHARDYTGNEIERILVETARNNPNIELFEDHSAIDLITEHQVEPHKQSKKINCYGAYAFDRISCTVDVFAAKITLLATGGAGQVYLHTTNPSIETGDGFAMAYRAGATLANLEFMQFHPTTLYHPEAKSFLISEAVGGAGAVLRDKNGDRFMSTFDKRAEFAPRDIIARAIDSEFKRSGDECVYLDLSPIGDKNIVENFPQIYSKCKEYKLDIGRELVPVVSAAHYLCGRIVTDLYGKTSIGNIYVCGEVAHTGVHGANRLASNSLLEALVYSHRSALTATNKFKLLKEPPPVISEWNDSGTINNDEWVLIRHDKHKIRNLIWDYVGIVRSDFRLNRAEKRIKMILPEVEEFYRKTKISEELLESRNLATVSSMIVTCAIMRKKNRGLHYTIDYPEVDNKHFKHDTVIKQSIGNV